MAKTAVKKSVSRKKPAAYTKRFARPRQAAHFFSRHKLVCLLVALLVITFFMMGYNKFRDYKNARYLKQIVTDFEQLEKDLKAKGIPAELKKGCFTTSEKFGSGVTGCYLEIIGNSKETVQDQVSEIVFSSGIFRLDEDFRYGVGNYINYLGYRCTLGFSPSDQSGYKVDCGVEVREANLELQKELFAR